MNKNIKSITKIYFLTRVAMILFLLIVALATKQDLSEVFLRFDGERYLDIALNGYTQMNYAFFPATPLIIKMFNLIGIPVIGYVIFNIATTYLTTIYIYKLCNEYYKYELESIKKIIYFWSLSPIALFTFILYTDGLFLFLCVLTFYTYKTKKNEYLTGVLLGLTVLTRSFGAMLFFAIFIKILTDIYKYKTPLKEGFIYVCKIYIPATIISLIYPIYLFFKTGNLFYFSEVQFEYWKRVPSNIFTVMKTEMELFLNSKGGISLIYILNSILFLSAMVFILITLIKLNKNRVENLDLILYIIFSLIACFSTMRFDGIAMPTCSMYRYLYGLFPIYIVSKSDICQRVSFRILILLNIIVIFNYAVNIFLT